MRALGRALALVGTAVGVVACGGGSSSSDSPAGGVGRGANVVDIYSSLPLRGASAAHSEAIVNGIRLALQQAHGKAGRWTVKYTSLDDSSAATGRWSSGQTAADARRAATDPRAVYYIGEFDSQASAVSMPILNVAGVPQVSPANTYVGLTTNEPGSASGEPQKYYSATRTYLRIMPRDSIQAAADLLAMKQAGCTKVAVANDKKAYGQGLAALLELEKAGYDMTITSNAAIDPAAANFRNYAAALKDQGADCFFFAGNASRAAVQITRDVHAALPKAKVFGGDRICAGSFTNSERGGIPSSIDPLLECTLPTLKLTAYPGGRNFLAAYAKSYHGSRPDPYAIYGYEAMKLGLDTIADLGPSGNSKSAVLRALFTIQARNSVLGTYGFDKNGDTTLKSYGLYKVGADGRPVFYRTLTPTQVM